jgi:glutamyl-tRNA reductase
MGSTRTCNRKEVYTYKIKQNVFPAKYSAAYKKKENHGTADMTWFRAFLYGGQKGKVVFRQTS